MTADSLQGKAWQRSLPAKRMGAGCVLRNERGEFLIVKPTYKEGWELPGGIVGDDESPWSACKREVEEELSLDVEPGALLCVDYCSTTEHYVESLMFLFDGGVLRDGEAARIQLDGSELAEHRWVGLDEAVALLGDRVGRRLSASIPHIGRGGVFMLDQQVVPPGP